MTTLAILLGVALVIAVVTASYLYNQVQKVSDAKPTQLSELEAIEKASALAKEKLIAAEKQALDIEKEAKQAISAQRKQLQEQEKNIQEREKKLMSRAKQLDEKRDDLEAQEKSLDKARIEVKMLKQSIDEKLESVAQLTQEEARQELQKKIEQEIQDWMSKRLSESEKELQEKSEEATRQILIDTLMNTAVDYVADTTTTVVEISDESMKSRIIGKNGRNIRAFERETGVDVIIDESPTEITISSFDPIRREVAAIAMKRLVTTGKINPAEIEDVVEKVKRDILKEIKKIGEELALESGNSDLPNEVIMLLGRYKFRYSYGQNLIKHTIEVLQATQYLAQELHIDPHLAAQVALIHDLGKVAPIEGKSYAESTTAITRKYFKNNQPLIEAIEALENKASSNTAAEIVRIADLISTTRPGAKRDSYEDYVKRIRSLEDIANQYEGITDSYAVRAGKELRVLVRPEDKNDEDTRVLSYNIAKTIESKQPGAGQVKVVVIRDKRLEAEAK